MLRKNRTNVPVNGNQKTEQVNLNNINNLYKKLFNKFKFKKKFSLELSFKL